MKKWVRMLVTTMIGGIVFLIPLVVVVMIVGKALKFTLLLAEPIAARLPRDTVGGIGLVSLIALALVFVICFIAGLMARRSYDLGIAKWFDAKLQDFVPRYTVIKAMTQRLASGSEGQLKTVLAKFDDNAQIAFEIDRSENGLVSLFLPGSPDPWSGTVIHMPAERVVPINAEFGEAIKSLKALGSGTAAILDGSNLSKEDVSL